MIPLVPYEAEASKSPTTRMSPFLKSVAGSPNISMKISRCNSSSSAKASAAGLQRIGLVEDGGDAALFGEVGAKEYFLP